MQWMDLTSDDMPEAIRQSEGLCVMPLGCLERHGPHLPLGTDTIAAEGVARHAAEIEPAVVFPAFYLGQIAEARHLPGAVSLPHDLLLRLLKSVLDEIGRNGFEKIIICNAHGGNDGLLSYLMRIYQHQPADYVPYAFNCYEMARETRERWAEMRTDTGGHAGEGETSQIMYLRPEAVKMANFRDPEDGTSRDMQAHLEGLRNPWGWYARFPTHLAGNPSAATPEKGEFLVKAMGTRLAHLMRIVKDDDVTPRLAAEFHRQAPTAGMETDT